MQTIGTDVGSLTTLGLRDLAALAREHAVPATHERDTLITELRASGTLKWWPVTRGKCFEAERQRLRETREALLAVPCILAPRYA